MRYRIRCDGCLATAWVRGEVCEGGFEVNGREDPEWEGRDFHGCTHDGTVEVIDEKDEFEL